VRALSGNKRNSAALGDKGKKGGKKSGKKNGKKKVPGKFVSLGKSVVGAAVSISFAGIYKNIVKNKKKFTKKCNEFFSPAKCFDVREGGLGGAVILDISGKPGEVRNVIVAIQQTGLPLKKIHLRDILSIDVIEYEPSENSDETNLFFEQWSGEEQSELMRRSSGGPLDSDDEDGMTSVDGVTSSLFEDPDAPDPHFKFPASTLPINKKAIVVNGVKKNYKVHTLDEFFTDMDVEKSGEVKKAELKRIFTEVLEFEHVDLLHGIDESWTCCKEIYAGNAPDTISRTEFNRLSICLRRYFEISKAFPHLNDDSKINKQAFLMLSIILSKWEVQLVGVADEFYTLTKGFDHLQFSAFRRWAMTFALIQSASPRTYVE